MTSWGVWASVPRFFAENVLVRAVDELSTSSRSIQPLLLVLPATNAATSVVTSAPVTYPAAWFAQPAGVPTSNESVRDPLAGLLSVVPNGWLFQVMPASVQLAVAAKRSIVRQAAGIALMYRRTVARRTVAPEGIAGLHCVRSNLTYSRWLAALALEPRCVVAVPKCVVALACLTVESMIDVIVAGVAVRVQVRYGVKPWDVRVRLAAAPPRNEASVETIAIDAMRIAANRPRSLTDRPGRGRSS